LSPVALADDGALLASGSPTSIPTLYRLPAGGSVWQSLGAVPGSYGNVVYIAGPGQGLLWSIGEGTTLTASYP
jgi:hypothetical protein